jgi:hypothetical protein
MNGQRDLPLDLRKMGRSIAQKTLDRQAKLHTFATTICDPSPTSQALMVPPQYRKTTFVTEGLDEKNEDGTRKKQSIRTSKNIISKMNLKVAFDSGNKLPKCSICVELKSVNFKSQFKGNL